MTCPRCRVAWCGVGTLWAPPGCRSSTPGRCRDVLSLQSGAFGAQGCRLSLLALTTRPHPRRMRIAPLAAPPLRLGARSLSGLRSFLSRRQALRRGAGYRLGPIAAHGGVNLGIDCIRPHRAVISDRDKTPSGSVLMTQQRHFRADVGRRGGTTFGWEKACLTTNPENAPPAHSK